MSSSVVLIILFLGLVLAGQHGQSQGKHHGNQNGKQHGQRQHQPHKEHKNSGKGRNFPRVVKSTLDDNGDGVPDNEDSLIEQIVEIFRSSTDKLADDSSPWLRQAHVKQHACMRATLDITNSQPAFQSGVFTSGASYKVFVRWSNGAGPGFATGFTGPRNDALPDNRAIAIKLLGVQGPKMIPEESDAETQDFLFTTSQAAFLKDASQALDFFSATAKGTVAQGAYLAAHPSLAAKYALDTPAEGLVKDLATSTFYSNAPNRFGSTYAKFKLQACDGNPSKFTVPLLTNYYHDRWAKDINAGDICYGFYVQLYNNDGTTPLEDGTAVWKTAWTRLGTLTFDSNQSWGNDAQEETCENYSFNPWHTIQAHEPIGGIQRVRKAVYTEMGKLRAQFGGFPFAEPTENDWDNFENL